MEPILKCITDKHPYVRKNAILTVPKLYITSPELAEEYKSIEIL